MGTCWSRMMASWVGGCGGQRRAAAGAHVHCGGPCALRGPMCTAGAHVHWSAAAPVAWPVLLRSTCVPCAMHQGAPATHLHGLGCSAACPVMQQRWCALMHGTASLRAAAPRPGLGSRAVRSVQAAEQCAVQLAW
jgi:hypothetical protein